MNCSSLVTKSLFIAMTFFAFFDAHLMDSSQSKKKQKYGKQKPVLSKSGCLFEMYGSDWLHPVDGRIYKGSVATALPEGNIAVAVVDPLGQSLIKVVDSEMANEENEFFIHSGYGFVRYMMLLKNKNILLHDKMLAMITSNKHLLVYDIKSKTLCSFFDKELTFNSSILQLSDGSIALVSKNPSIKIFSLVEIENGESSISFNREISLSCGNCTAALQLKNGNIVSGTDKGSIHIFDYESDDSIADKYGKHASSVFKIFELDCERFASLSGDAINIWSTISGDHIDGVEFDHNDDLFDAFCVNGELVLVRRCGQIHIRDAQSLGYLRTLHQEHGQEITNTVLLKNGIFATKSKDLTIKLWDPLSSQSIKTLKGCTSKYPLSSLFENSSGNLVSVTQNECLRIWKTNDLEPKSFN